MHDDLPDVAFRWPDPYFGVPEGERARRIQGTSDTCVIDNEYFFIRGVVLVPIIGTTDHLGLGIWVSQSAENFQTYLRNFDTPDIGPYFGWLSNSISFYEPTTWAMKTMVHFQSNNQRPLIEIAPCDHQLYQDYAQGVTLDRAWEITHARNRPRVA
jgi:hypothetical protein